MKSAHDFTMKAIDGKDVPLSVYKGKATLFVNVASRCGYTPQYKGLQALHERYNARGLVVLGFPSNDFMGQEPGTEAEISQFCETRYGVTFPMFAKIRVKGEDKHPLYAVLTEGRGEVSWNFNKILVDKDGRVVEKFDSKVTPDDPKLIAAIEKVLPKNK